MDHDADLISWGRIALDHTGADRARIVARAGSCPNASPDGDREDGVLPAAATEGAGPRSAAT